MHILRMEIVDVKEKDYIINISKGEELSKISFNPYEKKLQFISENSLSLYLLKNEYQLRKMLHNKRIDTYFLGFNLVFVLRNNKDIAGFNDRNKIIVLDKRNNSENSYVIDKGEKIIHEIYIDGSYSDKKRKGAFTVIIKNTIGDYKSYVEESLETGSSQTELRAAIKGVELLRNTEKIRIITDSQYVRKGLTEWIMCWKLNGWKTANGEKVKNIDNWKRFDELTNGKYIEFQWVKAHSNHFENTLCDLYAKKKLEELL
ncbi:ribonuclease H family protein [Clostridium sediminicola]|uniref:ribonuclease H family protein n=1 Tax=Clostridium sediminicola TaxID=3114879 RepID=UPI003D162522